MRNAILITTLLAAATAFDAQAGASRVGLNGANCAFDTINQAIAASQPGDQVYAETGTYSERLVVTHTVRLYPAQAGCNTQHPTGRVVVDGAGLPAVAAGGLVHISNGAGALFVRFDLRNGQAQRGGIAAVLEDGQLVLRNSTMLLGTATGADGGGCVLLENAYLGMDTESLIVNCAAPAGPGGGVRAIASEISLTGPGAIGFIGAGNSASGDGGGIHALNSTIECQGFVMLENQSGNDGGAIHAEATFLDFDNCDISFNQASRSGGALRLLGTATNSGAELIGTTFFSNATTTFTANEGGGAIYASGGTQVALSGSGVFENSAANLGGGVVVRLGADLIANDSVFSNNTAGGPGGAIYASQTASSVELVDVNLDGNESGSLGGAIQATFAPVSALRTTFEANSSGSDGGAAYLWLIDGVMPWHNVRMVDNSAGSEGGALFLNDSEIDFREILGGASACNTGALGPGEQCAEMSGNEAVERGGAVASSEGSLTASGAWIRDNVAGTTGGALWATEFVLTLEDTRIEGNQAATVGGGVHMEETGGGVTTVMSMNGGRIAGNTTVLSAVNSGGGGVYLTNVDADFIDVAVENNSTVNSGGFLHARNGSELTFTGGSIVGNSSDASGGAFYLAQSTTTLLLDSTTLASNEAGTTGGAIHAVFAPVTARDSLIAGNSADRGGGAYLWLNDGNLFENTRLIGNTTVGSGGGVYLNNAYLTMRSHFPGGDGCLPAAIGIDEYCAEIRGNSAGGSGGGIILEGNDTSANASPRLFVDGVAFIDNHADLTGAAIFIADLSPDADQDGPAAELINALIKENSDATLQVEAVRVGEDSVVLLDSVTLVANEGAPLVADGDDFDLTVRNTVMWANTLGPFASFGGSLSRTCTNNQTGQAGSQFFGSGVNPQFVSTARGPYRLDPATSPLIDLCGSGPQWDLDGGLRPGRTAWDVGAFEVEAGELGPEIFANGFESGP